MNETHDMRRTKDAVLAQITKDHITPRPRWHFLAEEGAIWALGVLSVVIGAFAVAAILFELRYAAWDLYLATHESFIDFILDALPFVWIALFGLFGVAVYQSIRHTKRGYRYSLGQLLAASLASSVVAGVCIFVVGGGRFIDEGIGHYMPLHTSLFERERHAWDAADIGRLAGVVEEVHGQKRIFLLRTMGHEYYSVDVSGFDDAETIVAEGDHVRILGIPSSTPRWLFGCAIFVKSDDVLFSRALNTPLSVAEKKTFFARTTHCREVRPYARLAPHMQ
jgi:hypothetical protein